MFRRRTKFSLLAALVLILTLASTGLTNIERVSIIYIHYSVGTQMTEGECWDNTLDSNIIYALDTIQWFYGPDTADVAYWDYRMNNEGAGNAIAESAVVWVAYGDCGYYTRISGWDGYDLYHGGLNGRVDIWAGNEDSAGLGGGPYASIMDYFFATNWSGTQWGKLFEDHWHPSGGGDSVFESGGYDLVMIKNPYRCWMWMTAEKADSIRIFYQRFADSLRHQPLINYGMVFGTPLRLTHAQWADSVDIMYQLYRWWKDTLVVPANVWKIDTYGPLLENDPDTTEYHCLDEEYFDGTSGSHINSTAVTHLRPYLLADMKAAVEGVLQRRQITAGRTVIQLADAGDFPHLASKNEAIFVTFGGSLNGSASSVLIDNQTTYCLICGDAGDSNVYIDGNSQADTIFFDNNAISTLTERQAFIALNASVTDDAPHWTIDGIKVARRTDSTGAGARDIATHRIRDFHVTNSYLEIDGYEALNLWMKRCVWGNLIEGNTIVSNSTSYSDRQAFDNGNIIAFNDTWYTSYAYSDSLEDSVNVRILDNQFLDTPHGGISVGQRLRAIIDGNTVWVDAQNDEYDTTGCFPGSCGTGHSAANAYAIRLDKVWGGTIVNGNFIYSSTEHQGGRGILVENPQGTSTDSVHITNNFAICHNGPDGENTDGQCRVLRQRSLAPDAWDYVNVTGNWFICVLDSDLTTTSIGTLGSGLQFTNNASEYNHGLFEHNICAAVSLNNDRFVRSFGGYYAVEDNITSQMPIVSRYNVFIGSQFAMAFADYYNAMSGHYLTLTEDTFITTIPQWLIDTLSNHGYSTPVACDSFRQNDENFVASGTFLVGNYNYPNDEVYIDDGYYGAGASDTAIRFWFSNTHELIIRYTIAITVTGGELGDSVWVISGYNDTTRSALDASGLDSVLVTTFYASTAGDSTGFNSYTVQAMNATDTTSDVIAVSATNRSVNLAFGPPPTPNRPMPRRRTISTESIQ